MYRTRLSGHGIELCGAPDVRVEPDGAGVERAEVTVLLDQPLGVVAGGEGAGGVADLVDGLEDVSVDGLLLQRPEEPLDHAVRFWLSDEGIARGHAPEPDLLLEVIGHEVAAVVMSQREATGGVGAEVAELLADGHAKRLGGLEAGAGLRHMPAEQFGVPMLGDGEQPDLAVLDGGDQGAWHVHAVPQRINVPAGVRKRERTLRHARSKFARQVAPGLRKAHN